eukprot:gene8546-7212_t
MTIQMQDAMGNVAEVQKWGADEWGAQMVKNQARSVLLLLPLPLLLTRA